MHFYVQAAGHMGNLRKLIDQPHFVADRNRRKETSPAEPGFLFDAAYRTVDFNRSRCIGYRSPRGTELR